MDNITTEISKLRRQFYRQYRKRPSHICLDALAESKLTAYMVSEILSKDDYVNALWKWIDIDDILRKGIRHLELKIYNMDLIFDYPCFCVRGNIENNNNHMIELCVPFQQLELSFPFKNI